MNAYTLYGGVVFALFIVTLLFLTRNCWLQKRLSFDPIYTRVSTSFRADIDEGFSSDNFNLEENIATDDTRAGLDISAKQKIRQIMHKHTVGFDEARRIYTERTFRQHGIGPDGRPQDPKFVSFS